MKDADLERYRDALLQLRGRLTEGINRLAELVLADERPAGEHDQLTSEPLDKEVYLDNAEEAIRQQVIDALHRIDSGTFGDCQQCGKPVADERLEAVPYASFCIQCERDREKSRRPRR